MCLRKENYWRHQRSHFHKCQQGALHWVHRKDLANGGKTHGTESGKWNDGGTRYGVNGGYMSLLANGENQDICQIWSQTLCQVLQLHSTEGGDTGVLKYHIPHFFTPNLTNSTFFHPQSNIFHIFSQSSTFQNSILLRPSFFGQSSTFHNVIFQKNHSGLTHLLKCGIASLWTVIFRLIYSCKQRWLLRQATKPI